MEEIKDFKNMSERNHHVAVTGIVIKDGKYLIVKRAGNREKFNDLWTVPGGKIERKDYGRSKDTSEHWYNVLEDNLRREVKEEVGLEIKNIKYLTSLTFMKGEVPVLVVSMYADFDRGEVVLNEEGVDYKWVSLEEARDYDLIEGIYEELEMMDRVLRGEGVGGWGKGDKNEAGKEFNHIAKNLQEKKKLVYTAQSCKNFYQRMLICKHAFEQGVVPMNPFNTFGYYLYELVDRNLVRNGNNNLMEKCDELWVYGEVSDGVLAEVQMFEKWKKPIKFFDISNLPKEVKEISKKDLVFEDEVKEFAYLIKSGDFKND